MADIVTVDASYPVEVVYRQEVTVVNEAIGSSSSYRKLTPD